MRHTTFCLWAAMALFVVNAPVFAQDADNGRRISERSCASCHAIDATKSRRAISFAAIAAKPGMSAEIVASFLLMPQMTMPGLPLRHNEAQDVAAFIMTQKK